MPAASRPQRLSAVIAAVVLAAALLPWSSVGAGAAGTYLLPVPAGTAVYVTQGNGVGDHIGAGQYAFDLAEASDPEFALVAARGGRIIGLRTDSTAHCVDDSCWTEANYVLVDHDDKTAALYLHLARGSVTVTIGQTVLQGQPLANADNTGWSTGNHLHFQVESTPGPTARSAAGWWWTQSIPIAFADQSVLAVYPGGVPTASSSLTLVSGNAPASGPTPTPTSAAAVLRGTWVSPSNGATIKTTMSTLTAKPAASLSDVTITKVVYSVVWGGRNPILACIATKAASDGSWGCTADFAKLGAPLGALILSFDVYDDAGDVTHSPDGTRSVAFAAPPVAPTNVTGGFDGTYYEVGNPSQFACRTPILPGDPFCFTISMSWHEAAGPVSSFRTYRRACGIPGN